ncbi:MAG: hypothetical protein AAF322_07880 [Pseudomonadota bacterium]
MAVASRKPKGVKRHSDEGSQCASRGFGHRRHAAGVRPRYEDHARRARRRIRHRRSDQWRDMPRCESFFAKIERELLDRRRFVTKAKAPLAAFRLIENFYNPSRRHSSVLYRSPIEFDAANQTINVEAVMTKTQPMDVSGSTPTHFLALIKLAATDIWSAIYGSAT